MSRRRCRVREKHSLTSEGGMSNSRQVVIALALAASSACASRLDLTDPSVIAAELRGTWSETFTFPGASTVFQLSVGETTFSGTGTFAVEAGPSGTLSVAGQIVGSLVKIDFARSDGLVGHFQGTLRGGDLLTGSLSYTSGPMSAEFRRTSH